MNKLPSEVLHKIFIQLDLKHRLECSTVCRSWWKVLDSCILFYSVKISTNNQFNRFMDAFEQLPHHASQVEQLRLEYAVSDNVSERSLFTTFPNVCMISMGGKWHHFMKRDGVAYSKSKLEYLSEYSPCTLTSQMLSLNLGDRLETLELYLSDIRDSPSVFSQLKDLPVLKKLHLSSPQIKIHEVENIHHNIPSIQDFSLTMATLLASRMPFYTAPATSITKFEFTPQNYADPQTCVQMYQYMIRKYTNINKINYCENSLNNYSAGERRYIYSNGIIDFLKIMGSKQSSLSIQDLPDGVNTFEALDAGNAQIKELRLVCCESQTIFQDLGQSKQSESIKSLYTLDVTVDSIYSLKNMTSLALLSIRYFDSHFATIDLANVLEACPSTLKNLDIGTGVMATAPFSEKVKSIEYLNLGWMAINSNVGDIISNCFPNLIDLTLYGTVVKNAHMTIKNPHFQKAELTMEGFDSCIYNEKCKDIYTKCGISFKCPSMTEAQYYINNITSTTRANFEDVQGLPFLSVETCTEKKMKPDSSIWIH